MSWLLRCFHPGLPSEPHSTYKELRSKGASRHVSPTGGEAKSSVVECQAPSPCNECNAPAAKSFPHALSSHLRKASQPCLRLSEDTIVSALSTTPNSLNPLAILFPYASGGQVDYSTSQTRVEDSDALRASPQQHQRSNTDFVELCGVLENLVYLGEGSNGVVYSASWYGARVAVKFLLGPPDDPPHLQRCLTEALLTRLLSHPHVVQCFAAATAQLTQTLWERITARNRRSRSLLTHGSLGRSVAAAVAQQVAQERAAAAPRGAGPWGGGGGGVHAVRALSYQSPHPVPQHDPSRRRNTEQYFGTAPVPYPQTGMRRMEGGASALLDSRRPPPPPPPQQQQREADDQMERYLEALGTEDRAEEEEEEEEEIQSGRAGSTRAAAGAGGGVPLQQALCDLRAEVGRHCTLVVMELMDAGTLHGAIGRGDFSARRAPEHRPRLLSLLVTAQEVAQGMAHLHALDLLHGDLKPTNVLLRATPPRGPAPAESPTTGGGPSLLPSPVPRALVDLRGYSAKIADLGLARPCAGESAELSSDEWGALAYLAPEAAKGRCSRASDVYSFGVILWEMASGVRPYLGLTAPQILLGLVSGTLQLNWPKDGTVYDPLRTLAIACTDPNAAERPAFEVAARLLGRMVRHIRTASAPLRQRHSSALSMELGREASLVGAGPGISTTGAGSTVFTATNGGAGNGTGRQRAGGSGRAGGSLDARPIGAEPARDGLMPTESIAETIVGVGRATAQLRSVSSMAPPRMRMSSVWLEGGAAGPERTGMEEVQDEEEGAGRGGGGRDRTGSRIGGAASQSPRPGTKDDLRAPPLTGTEDVSSGDDASCAATGTATTATAPLGSAARRGRSQPAHGTYEDAGSGMQTGAATAAAAAVALAALSRCWCPESRAPTPGPGPSVGAPGARWSVR